MFVSLIVGLFRCFDENSNCVVANVLDTAPPTSVSARILSSNTNRHHIDGRHACLNPSTSLCPFPSKYEPSVLSLIADQIVTVVRVNQHDIIATLIATAAQHHKAVWFEV